jgi:hypothetical protein
LAFLEHDRKSRLGSHQLKRKRHSSADIDVQVAKVKNGGPIKCLWDFGRFYEVGLDLDLRRISEAGAYSPTNFKKPVITKCDELKFSM